jgi:hypothetical protein
MKKTAALLATMTVGVILAGCSSSGGSSADNKATCAAFANVVNAPAQTTQAAGQTLVNNLGSAARNAGDSSLQSAANSFVSDFHARSSKVYTDAQNILSACKTIGFGSLLPSNLGSAGSSGSSSTTATTGNSGSNG